MLDAPSTVKELKNVDVIFKSGRFDTPVGLNSKFPSFT